MQLLEAKNAAEQADRGKSLFLANISHEIRTPIHGILGHAELLKDSGQTEKQMIHIHTIEQCGDALLRLINDILTFSKLERQKLELENRHFMLPELINSTVEMFEPLVTKKDIRLDVDLTDVQITGLIVDSHRLRQIFNNLISNAIKFTTNGLVQVRVTSRSNVEEGKAELIFEVKDTGIGMSDVQMRRIFLPFEQGDSSISLFFGGTGLGLSIAYQLVELMGGTLKCKSDLGKGSVFEVCMTLDHAQEEDFFRIVAIGSG